jgi:hypothetical protein
MDEHMNPVQKYEKIIFSDGLKGAYDKYTTCKDKSTLSVRYKS